jgi:hypothetical protein
MLKSLNTNLMGLERRQLYHRRPAIGLALLLAGFVALRLTALGQPRIVAWGDFSSGTNIPTGITDIRTIAAGPNYGLLLRSNGTVVVWGDNSSGQTNVPPSLTSVAAIAAGGNHCLALRSNGTVAAWGLNNFGQATVPASVTNAIAIAAGAYHSLALRSNGTVVVWGGNLSAVTNIPAGLNGVTAISAGDAHSLVLRTNGTLAAWGDNGSGQTNLPVSLGLTNIMKIAAGYHHNLAVRSNGTVVAWDAGVVNVYGESTVPANLTNIASVAAGYFLSLAVSSNGTVSAWGQNFTSETNVPPGLTNVTTIATGTSPSSDFCAALTPSPLCPPGFPDNFECRIPLSGSNISFSPSNLGATSEPGEPQHSDLDAQKSVWYSWTAPFSGGAVLSATSDFKSPIVAVYTGTSVTALTRIVANTTAFSHSRPVFSAVAGTTYQIAVDGTTVNGSTGEGHFAITLVLSPPPTNDAFASRLPISGNYLETAGSFDGTTREPGEPLHTNSNGDATFQQTLWWTWLAPTNLGVTTIPVSLVADAVSFPPNIGVYTGTSVSALTQVPGLTAQTNGMTRMASFIATAGTQYQVALAGIQNDPLGEDASPRIGNYRFRFNIHALALSFAGLNLTNNPNNSVGFGANLQVTNYGAVPSLPLRAQITANAGVSVLGTDTGYATNAQIPLLTTNLPSLQPGQGLVRRIIGTIPAPSTNPGPVLTNGVGYGAFGQLQEQVDTNWFTVDQALLSFGVWPDLGGFGGPGGGVIRLDPGLTGAGFNPLAGVSILGAGTIQEGQTTNYIGNARYANSYLYTFSNTVWTTTLFSIATNGIFSTGSTTSNTTATLTAAYSSGGFNYSTATNVAILNLPPPVIDQLAVAGTNFTFRIQGVAGRSHVIEATTNLSPPVSWSGVSNVVIPAGGLFNFTNTMGTNSARFFRVRES